MEHFSTGKLEPMTKQQVRKDCPVAFETAPTNPGVSSSYLHVNTETIIDDLNKLGWYPVKATMRKRRKKDSESIFSKHMVVFQNENVVIRSEDEVVYPQIILMNSHDGLNSFKFYVGIYRMICSNGLVIADEKFSNFSIRHKGYTFGELRKVVTDAVEDLPARVEVLNRMKNQTLTTEQKHDLAIKALLLRSGITPGTDEAKELKFPTGTLAEMVLPTRKEDLGDDLWKVLNVLQEKITQGGFKVALAGAKIRKIRKIQSFEKDLKINQDLFRIATSMVN